MSEYNVITTSAREAEEYTRQHFESRQIDFDRSLPDFYDNYIFLQKKMDFALNIPRSRMPVIEPKDMSLFRKKIQSGHIDIFKPYAKTYLWPAEFKRKQGHGWLTLGLKDGDPSDDVLEAEMIHVPAEDLKPLQKQIWLDEVVKGMLKFGLPTTEKMENAPIIISSEKYIIDGHHRWAQAIVTDPSIEMYCLHMPLDIVTLLNLTKTYGSAIGNQPNM
jgi:hypothetical protein